MIAIDGAHLSGPAIQNHQIPHGLALAQVAFVVANADVDAEEGPRGRAGLQGGRPRQRRDQDAARFCLPPGVNDRAALLAHHPVIPFPGLRVDGFAHGAQQAQTGAAGLLNRLRSITHQGADRRRGRIEDVHLVFIHDLPEPAGIRIIGYAFKHQGDGAVGQRPVDDVAVPGDPADVRRAPVDVAVVIVEHVLMSQ